MTSPDPKKPLLQWLRLASDDTSDVFFSCVMAIVASTFLSLHLNVPQPPPSDPPNHLLDRLWRARVFRQFRRQCIWAGMCVVAPELLVSLAFGENRAASRGARIFRAYGRGNVASWLKAHAFLANMGGLEFLVQLEGQEIPDSAGYPDVLRPTILTMLFRLEEPTASIIVTSLRRSFGHLSGKLLRTYDYMTQILQRLLARAIAEFQAAFQSPLGVIKSAVEHFWKLFSSRLPRRSPADCSRGNSGNTFNDVGLTELPRSSHGRGVHNSPGSSSPQDGSPGAHNEDTTSLPQHQESTQHDSGVSASAAAGSADDQSHNIPPVMAGTYLGEDGRLPTNGTETSIFLNATQIAAAQILGIIDLGPALSTEQVEDRGKTNVFMKGFAVFQLFWFGMRCVVQLGRGQPMTQLELATFTYVVCALLAYALYWSKPQGVELPIQYRVALSNTVRPATDQDIDILRRFSGMSFLTRNFVPPFGMDVSKIRDPRQQVPADSSTSVFTTFGSESNGVCLFDDDFAGVVVGMLFGLLYCLGWNHGFPSRWELVAWRSASIAITASLVPYSVANGICTVYYADLYRSGKCGRTHIAHKLSLYGLLWLYVVCRLFMLVEMVRTLVV